MSPTQIPLPAASPRIETGAIQFGDDWPGLFVRGYEAIMLAANIRFLLAATPHEPAVMSASVRSALVRLADIADVIERDVVVGQTARATKAAGKKPK